MRPFLKVSLVMDRIFLLLFSLANVLGTVVILMKAPSLFDAQPVLQSPPPIVPLGGDTFNVEWKPTVK